LLIGGKGIVKKMKLSFAVSLQKTNFSYIVDNYEWQKKIRLLSDLGYQGVEFSIKDPKVLNVNALKRILHRYKLELSAIGTGAVFIDEGLSLSSLEEDIRVKAIKRIKGHIDLASLFGTQVIIGLVRGKNEKQKTFVYQSKKKLLDSTKNICDYAVSKKVILLVEPLNRYETSFLHNVEQTLAFIKEFKCKNLRLLLDIFHMNIEENNLIEPIQKGIKYLSHFHFADNNRRCPGDGYINFAQIVAYLKKMGYRGYLSGEMLPIPNAERCIRKFFRTIKPYIG
jgi:sugar phosphate isomerase/epimerase